jgi:hypothetical protein
MDFSRHCIAPRELDPVRSLFEANTLAMQQIASSPAPQAYQLIADKQSLAGNR